jgi:hypothetical protein
VLAVLAVGAYLFFKSRERRLARAATGSSDETTDSEGSE